MFRLPSTILAILIAVPALAQPVRAGVEARATVVVGADGNGAFVTSFSTTVGGEDTRYFLALQETTQMEISSIEVVLNDERVLIVDDTTVEFPRRIRVALTPVGGEANTLMVTAHGAPGSAARFAVVAERDDRRTGGRSVLPLGRRAANQPLTIHNAGTSPVAFRFKYFNLDGTAAGSGSPTILAPHATAERDPGGGAPPGWQAGAVSRGMGFARRRCRHGERRRDGPRGIALRARRPCPVRRGLRRAAALRTGECQREAE